jgi:phosphoethanolamine N-methyltransferase
MGSEPSSNDLDAGQYTPDAIRMYETVYGRNFISPGGAASTRAVLALVALTPATRVLDVGCGLGGAAFLIAQTFGARVHGIDLSRNMLQLARARCQAAGLSHAVSFEQIDIVRYHAPAAYDLAHSRDVFLHIHDKAGLFAALARCLRPGGRLLFTDYLRRPGAQSSDFKDYIRARNYALCTLDEYRALMEGAGFGVIAAEDRTPEFIAILERELDGILASGLEQRERDDLAQSWQAKLRRARAGEQRWGVFLGAKPAAGM